MQYDSAFDLHTDRIVSRGKEKTCGVRETHCDEVKGSFAEFLRTEDRIGTADVSPGNSSEAAESPVASNQNAASESEIQHVGFCSLGAPTNARHIFNGIGEVSVMTTEDSSKLPASTPINCNCAAIRRYASMIQSPTDDEIAIIYLALLVGWNNAEEIAPAMGLKSNRPLRKLLT
jgi:hypothetical protein